MKLRQFHLILLLLTFPLSAFAQIAFEPGYVIMNDGEKVNCLIKNRGWQYNPANFEFKYNSHSKILKGDVSSVLEFGIGESIKYRNTLVTTDTTSTKIEDFDQDRLPKNKVAKLFLKVLLEGEINIFSYHTTKFKRYYYQSGGGETKQLIYKKFLNQNNDVQENNFYLEQLEKLTNCAGSKKGVAKRRYTKQSILKEISRFHDCTGKPYVILKPKVKKDLFNLTIRPQIRRSTLDVSSPLHVRFKNTMLPRSMPTVGIEAEFILPFNKNKWALFIEPTYNTYVSSTDPSVKEYFTSIRYRSIEFPVGLRYYMFLNRKSALFINPIFSFDYAFNSDADYRYKDFSSPRSIGVHTVHGAGLGIGFKYGKRLSVEGRFQTGRELFGDLIYWVSSYETMSFHFGYTLF